MARITFEANSIEEMRDICIEFLKKQTPRQKIDVLDLDVRGNNCLKAENIFYVDELTRLSADDLKKTPNLGQKSIGMIQDALRKHGLYLRGEEP